MRVHLDTQADLATFCKRLREGAGLTQKQLAEALGYKGAQVIGNAENPRDEQRHGVRGQIVEHFGKRLRTVYVVEDQ